MTCRAILFSDGNEHIPALRVRTGELTAKQCDHEYKGERGECPTCKAMRESTDFADGGTFALAMAQRDPVVTYRRFAYQGLGVEPIRICGFGHFPGYWNDFTPGDCSSIDTETHRVNLLAIKRWYEKEMEGCAVKMEERLRKPGDPPQPYTPDLAVYGPRGERLVAVEYQRSYESFEKFEVRHRLRQSEGWAVHWWFDDTRPLENPSQAPWQGKTVYEKSQEHRVFLALVGADFYRCWVCPDTAKMQADYGACGDAPEDRKKRVAKKVETADLKECSIADMINSLEGQPEKALIKDFIKPRRVDQKPRANPEHGVELMLDLAYSKERERKAAIAIMKMQDRLAEQDRRHREWVQKKKICEEIRSKQSEWPTPLRFEPDLKAEIEVLKELLEECDRIAPKAQQINDIREATAWMGNKDLESLGFDPDEEILAGLPSETLNEFLHRAEQYTEAWVTQRRIQGLKDLLCNLVAQPESRGYYENNRGAIDAAMGGGQFSQEELNRLVNSLQNHIAQEKGRIRNQVQQLKQWVGYRSKQIACYEEQRRNITAKVQLAIQGVEDSRWRKIEYSEESFRGARIMTTPLLVGGFVRHGHGARVEIYQGRSGAGYSTDMGTYGSLEGFQVWTGSQPPTAAKGA